MRYHHLSSFRHGAPTVRVGEKSRILKAEAIRFLIRRIFHRKASPSVRHDRRGRALRVMVFSLGGLASRKGFGLLVSLGCRRYRLCTCDLSTSSSLTALCGDLILRRASCLDAFSTYPVPTRLPGGAPGGTTGSPVVGPTRSSRTSVGSSQISCAHNR